MFIFSVYKLLCVVNKKKEGGKVSSKEARVRELALRFQRDQLERTKSPKGPLKRMLLDVPVSLRTKIHQEGSTIMLSKLRVSAKAESGMGVDLGPLCRLMVGRGKDGVKGSQKTEGERPDRRSTVHELLTPFPTRRAVLKLASCKSR